MSTSHIKNFKAGFKWEGWVDGKIYSYICRAIYMYICMYIHMCIFQHISSSRLGLLRFSKIGYSEYEMRSLWSLFNVQ